MKKDIFKTFFRYTRCNITDEMRAFLWKLFGSKSLKITNRLYSMYDDGQNHKDFHRQCDKKGTTLSLFQIKDGDCIGGYTSQHWDDSDTYKADSSAFVFNLTRSRHFPSQASGKDIYCSRNWGPFFSGGNGDLAAGR